MFLAYLYIFIRRKHFVIGLLAVWRGLRPANPCLQLRLAPPELFLGSAGKGRFLVPACRPQGVARNLCAGRPEATALARRVASLTAASAAPGWSRMDPTERMRRA